MKTQHLGGIVKAETKDVAVSILKQSRNQRRDDKLGVKRKTIGLIQKIKRSAIN